MRTILRHHEILEQFLGLVLNTPVLSAAALPVQRFLIQAAIDLLPPWARELLRLENGQRLRVAMRPVVGAIVTLAGRLLRNGPPQQARHRMATANGRE
jgi:uncharacterized protein (DUF2236 family)